MAKTLSGGSRVVAVTGPSSMAKPTREGLLALEKDVAAREIDPYVDVGPSEPNAPAMDVVNVLRFRFIEPPGASSRSRWKIAAV